MGVSRQRVALLCHPHAYLTILLMIAFNWLRFAVANQMLQDPIIP